MIFREGLLVLEGEVRVVDHYVEPGGFSNPHENILIDKSPVIHRIC
jgi:hypothetical protein